jgi:competence protein ComEC
VGVGVIAFFFGILAIVEFPALPDPFFVQFTPLLVLLLVVRPLRLLALFLLGCLWALFRADLVLCDRLPLQLEARDLVVEGNIASLPSRRTNRTLFLFEIEKILERKASEDSPKRARLSWFGHTPELTPGDRWRLTVRLKQPRGFMNPGAFDYEGWLFQQRIGATGYVRREAPQQRLGSSPDYPLTRLRLRLINAIDQVLADAPNLGIIRALAIGERSRVSEETWTLLRATGTSHLMAISGLHVGLVAGMAFVLVRRLWPLSHSATLLIAAPRMAATMAIVGAFAYALLAGFSIPTRRAVIMITVLMLGIILQRNLAFRLSLAWALFMVLIVDPFSVLSIGFWLSFGAVAVILFGMQGYLSNRSAWWKWGRVQVLIVAGLLPLTLFFFQEQSLIAPIANLIAVPWVGILMLPLILFGTMLLFPLPAIGELLLTVASHGMDLLWRLLEHLASLDLMLGASLIPPKWAVAAGCVGVVLLLAPSGFPGRWLGFAWLLPLGFLPTPRPNEGELWFTLLDVGQGLSVVVQTREHVLVYDTGPRFSPSFDAGKHILVPFLRYHGIRHIDYLIISHEDSDHSGGFNSVRSEFSIGKILGNGTIGKIRLDPCRRGQHWHWSGIDFQMLHPPPAGTTGRNNESCVVRIVSPGGSILIPGDIEERAEHRLLRLPPAVLKADILVAPHHGSSTSSTEAFLNAVQPTYALYAVGYRNRFGFPHRQVVARYQERGVELYASATSGAIRFDLGMTGELEPRLYRFEGAHFWHLPVDDVPGMEADEPNLKPGLIAQ